MQLCWSKTLFVRPKHKLMHRAGLKIDSDTANYSKTPMECLGEMAFAAVKLPKRRRLCIHTRSETGKKKLKLNRLK